MANNADTALEKVIGKRLPAILFTFILAGTILSSLLIHYNIQDASNERFMRISSEVSSSIQNRMQYYVDSLRQTASMFMASENVSANEFDVYTSNMGLESVYPGMSAIGYATFDPGSRLKTPITHLQPYQNDLISFDNFDMMENPSRQKAMLEAGSSGEPYTGDGNGIFDETKVQSQLGFIIYYPVYKGDTVPDTQADRLNNLQGFVFGIFNTRNLFNKILTRKDYFQEAIGIDISLREAGGLVETYSSSVLYGPQNHDPALERAMEVQLGGMTWVLNIHTLPPIENYYQPRTAYYIFFLGTLLSILVFIVARRFSKAKIAVEQSEERMRKVAKENSLLAQAGEILGKSLNTQTILAKLADFFATHFCDVCVIELSDEEKQQQIIRVSPGLRTEMGSNRLQLIDHAGKFVANRDTKIKVREKEGHIIEDDFEKEAFRSYLSLPMLIRGRLYGVINLLSVDEDKNYFQDQTAQLVHLTKISMIFVENTLLFEEAELANRLKDEFLATVSHELRTPLNVIYGHSQLLLESEMDPDHKDQIQSIYKSAQAQSTIIEDLLDVSAIISGKVNFNPRPVKVMSAIDAAMESVKLEAKKRKIELIFDEAHQCIIMGVKTRLVQIFWNLLSNAIKFTPEGGKIAVKTTVEDQNCVVKVMDTGRGIEDEFMPHIFEKFRQEDKVSTRNRGGLGLGLSIVSHLVNLHGGTIKAESEGKNKGSTFTVSFPIVNLTTRTGPQEEKEKLEEIQRHDLHHVSVLAVDDEPESLNLIARILRSYKATVITASNGQEALKMMKSERPDVLISDIGMPEMDGYELIKEIRQKEKGQGTHIPAIALTAFAQEEDKQRALSSGYEAYLSKPVNKDKLIGTVEQALH